ncbi:MAG: DUF928 domain-containing protein [Bacteroidetes bacterium]|nr:DUF928 domain-containing protein [Bacteroidota bacterium]
MIRYCLLLLLSFFAYINSFAQVTIQLQPINQIRFASEDVWSFSVTLTGDKPINVYFKAIVNNDASLPQVELISAAVNLSPGINLFNKQMLSTIKKNYFSQALANYELLSGELPPGDYTYCVHLICADVECSKVLPLETPIKECITIQKPQSTPLLLSTPEDKAKISDKRPGFTWIAPMPLGTNPDLTYQFTLVHLNKNQSAMDGIQRNRPLYSQSGIAGTTIGFPQELSDLQQEEHYAWQVKAVLGDGVVAVSEVWEFEIDKESKKLLPMPYVRLSKSDHTIYNAVNELKFIYFEPRKINQLNIHFYDASGKDVTPANVAFATKYGDNRFNLNLATYDFQPDELYTLEVISPTGEKYTLKFRFVFQFTN